jgi:predicted MFS family arabinose efflux permease
MLAAGYAATPFVTSPWALVFTLGMLSMAGAGAGSFAILIGATTRQLPAERRSFAAGFINAGGSLGQFVYAPLTQVLIAAFGWVAAMLTLAATALGTIPLARYLESRPAAAPAILAQAATESGPTMRQQLRDAARNPSYWCLHAGFFTCGFHLAFLVTHLPGEIELCGLTAGVAAGSLAIIGLANVAGSLGIGVLGNVYRLKMLLFWVYSARAAAIAIFLLAPKTSMTFYVFAAALGLTWLSTVPPTAGLVGKLFGLRYLATLFGLTLLSHQIGGFFGAWLGGIALVETGNYQWMWIADIALALGAAFVNLPIREARIVRVRLAGA